MTNAMSATPSSSSNCNTNQNSPSITSKTKTKWLIVDFDGTCTVQDTTPLLPHLTSLLQHSKESPKDKLTRQSKFDKMEQTYFKLYEEAKQKVFHSLQKERGTMSLKEALDTLDDASNKVTHQISSSGILRGLTKQITRRRVMSDMIAHHLDHDVQCKETVTLHDNCIQVLSQSVAASTATCCCWSLGVLSINWCPSLIDAALLRHVRQSQLVNNGKNYDNDEDSFPIWSNDVNHDGTVHLHVPGASAKMECIASLRRSNSFHKTTTSSSTTTTTTEDEQSDANHNDANDASSSPSPIVYIGDSTTDLLALLEADIGILFVPSPLVVSHLAATAEKEKDDNDDGDDDEKVVKIPTVIQIAKHYNVAVKPLSEYVSSLSKKEEDDGTNGQTMENKDYDDGDVIWITDTWEEIGLFLNQYP